MARDPVVRRSPPESLRPLPAAGHRAATGLPAALTPIVGREAELFRLIALLRNPAIRLVTLTGPGGVGKTRLAIEAAARVRRDFGGNVALVELASLEDPALVASTIVRSLRSEETSHSPTETLCRMISDREMLLVLDNLEHLLPATPLLTELLTSCPGLSILATSRARLRLRGEHEVPVEPLGLPDLSTLPPIADLTNFGAICLWSERARAANPAFDITPANAATVAAICHRLDGLPLAIELAAARSNVLTPKAILDRLEPRLPLLVDGPRDVPLRHQTMHAAVSWSYDLLSPEEQRLFRRLSAFVGGFTLDAVEEVAASSPDTSVLDVLSALVSNSLVRPVATPQGLRYGMLETIREFGWERLTKTGEVNEARDDHAAWFLALAEHAEPQLSGPSQSKWYDKLDAELGNLRAAFERLRERGSFEEALRLSKGIEWFLTSRGHFQEADEMFETLLRMSGTGVPSRTLAMVHVFSANTAHWLLDFDRAAARYERALVLFRASEDKRGLAIALRGLGSLAIDRNDLSTAEALLEEGCVHARESGTDWHLAGAIHLLGIVSFARGDFTSAIDRQEEALTIWRRLGDFAYVTVALASLGLAALSSGQLDRARAAYREALDLALNNHDLLNLARSCEGFAGLAVASGKHEWAAQLLGAADAFRLRSGTVRRPPTQLAINQTAERIAERLGADATAASQTIGRAMGVAEAVDLARKVADSRKQPCEATAQPFGLSVREIEVLRLLADGASDSEIATRLFISRYTASNHVHAILRKLGVSSRTAAASRAVRLGLV